MAWNRFFFLQMTIDNPKRDAQESPPSRTGGPTDEPVSHDRTVQIPERIQMSLKCVGGDAFVLPDVPVRVFFFEITYGASTWMDGDGLLATTYVSWLSAEQSAH
jgi:hypothetical protein